MWEMGAIETSAECAAEAAEAALVLVKEKVACEAGAEAAAVGMERGANAYAATAAGTPTDVVARG